MKNLFILLLLSGTISASAQLTISGSKSEVVTKFEADTTKVNLLVYGVKTGEVRVIAGHRVSYIFCQHGHYQGHYSECIKTFYLDCRKQRFNQGIKIIQEINN